MPDWYYLVHLALTVAHWICIDITRVTYDHMANCSVVVEIMLLFAAIRLVLVVGQDAAPLRWTGKRRQTRQRLRVGASQGLTAMLEIAECAQAVGMHMPTVPTKVN